MISDVISLRLPCTTRRRRPLNYIDCIARDIGHETADMQTLMSDRDTCVHQEEEEEEEDMIVVSNEHKVGVR